MAKSKKNKKNLIAAVVLLPLVAIGLSSYAVFKGIRNYTETSSYFNVRDVRAEGITDERYCELMRKELLGTNIFRINTGELSERIKRKFPTFYSVTVTRVLPSCLAIVAKERLPVAIMQSEGVSYLFDSEGVIIASFPSSQSVDFPVITGLEGRLQKLKAGSMYKQGTLKNVLALAKTLRLQRFNIDSSFNPSNKMKIERIDAANPSELYFYLGDTLQVKVGHNNFENRISLLPAIIKSLSAEIADIKYIDLRPREPVVATKKDSRKR